MITKVLCALKRILALYVNNAEEGKETYFIIELLMQEYIESIDYEKWIINIMKVEFEDIDDEKKFSFVYNS